MLLLLCSVAKNFSQCGFWQLSKPYCFASLKLMFLLSGVVLKKWEENPDMGWMRDGCPIYSGVAPTSHAKNNMGIPWKSHLCGRPLSSGRRVDEFVFFEGGRCRPPPLVVVVTEERVLWTNLPLDGRLGPPCGWFEPPSP